MKIRIITSCTGEKKASPENQLRQPDFKEPNTSAAFLAREDQLAEYRMPAEVLYTGQQHAHLMKGVQTFREQNGEDSTELWILSAGYGLIPGDRCIVPYECTFQTMKAPEIEEWARELRIPQDARKILAQPADMVIVLLGSSYLRALQLDDTVRFAAPTIFLASKSSEKHILGKGKLRVIPLGKLDAARFRVGLVGLKGALAAEMLFQLSGTFPETLARYFDTQVDFLSLFPEKTAKQEGRKTKRASIGPIPNPSVDQVIDIPSSWWEKPHRRSLKFYIPDWDDRVDPDYDFTNEVHSGGQGDWSNEVYAHQIYPEPSYDGILVSRAVVDKPLKKKQKIETLGVHSYLRVPRSFPVLGDCGAFAYIKEELPPYSTLDVIDYYTNLGFDLGVSVDHIILTETEEQKKFRYELTIHNAEEFLIEHHKRGLSWEPIGAVQGWDPTSYAQAAEMYLKMGYRYIGLGGLVRTNTKGILKVLEAVHQAVPPDINMHLFGIGRFDGIKDFVSLGVTSIDSASMLRKAWLGTDKNYLSMTDWYTAIRVPQTAGSFRAAKVIEASVRTLPDLQKLEDSCMKGLREYAASHCSNPTDGLMNDLVEYDTLVAGQRNGIREKIYRTLAERPWEKCECAVCQRWGIEVVIFRGNNRNRRRGFHNTYVFYQILQKIFTGEEIPWLIPENQPKQLELFPNK